MNPPATHHAAPDGHDWHELEVANPSFFIEKLGAECSDLQGLLELTVNALQAIAALAPSAAGRVVWDRDWQRIDATRGRERKLSVIDTGIGMTPEQMRYVINHLAATSHEQGRTKNYGVGAKVAAGSRNPHGLECRSWHQGHGALVRIKRHADGRWGLEPQAWPDGRSDFWRPLSEQDKPWLLRGQPHRTQVVLLGDRAAADTTQAPGSVTEARSHRVARYLNTRFLRLPDPIELLVREDHRLSSSSHDTGRLRRIHGQRHHIAQRANDAGAVDISDARVHGWVLDDDHRGRRRESGTWTSTGHAAALFQDERYDLLPQTRGGYGRLQDFGVRLGYERVVLYLEPQTGEQRLEAMPWLPLGRRRLLSAPRVRPVIDHLARGRLAPADPAVERRDAQPAGGAGAEHARVEDAPALVHQDQIIGGDRARPHPGIVATGADGAAGGTGFLAGDVGTTDRTPRPFHA